MKSDSIVLKKDRHLLELHDRFIDAWEDNYGTAYKEIDASWMVGITATCYVAVPDPNSWTLSRLVDLVEQRIMKYREPEYQRFEAFGAYEAPPRAFGQFKLQHFTRTDFFQFCWHRTELREDDQTSQQDILRVRFKLLLP